MFLLGGGELFQAFFGTLLLATATGVVQRDTSEATIASIMSLLMIVVELFSLLGLLLSGVLMLIVSPLMIVMIAGMA